MKQLAIAPHSKCSGDHRSPGPPNSAGAAQARSGKPLAATCSVPATSPCAETTYRCGNGCMTLLTKLGYDPEPSDATLRSP